MNATGKIVLYFIAVLFVGALLAPPLYWAGTSLVSALREESFQKFFNRAALIAALAFLWPLAKSFQIRSRAELGLEPNSRWLRDLVCGLFAAIAMMVVMCVILKGFEAFKWHDPEKRKLGDFPKILVTATTVSLIEEMLFRGAFLGVFLRTMGKWSALFTMSAIFSVLHFIKPTDVKNTDVSWYSGFELLPAVFKRFEQLDEVAWGLGTLFVVGWVLGYATIRTRSLWMAIGLHAGWIICHQGFGKIAKLAKTKMPLVGTELIVGIAPLLTIVATGLVCWLIVRRRAQRAE